MKTATTNLTRRAIEITEVKRDRAWDRYCKATLDGAKKFWENENNRLSRIIIKLRWRLED